MQSQIEADANGIAPKVPEITSEKLIGDFLHLVSKFTDGQFLYRAYVVKDGRSFE